jgi:hypothetical protein
MCETRNIAAPRKRARARACAQMAKKNEAKRENW